MMASKPRKANPTALVKHILLRKAKELTKRAQEAAGADATGEKIYTMALQAQSWTAEQLKYALAQAMVQVLQAWHHVPRTICGASSCMCPATGPSKHMHVIMHLRHQGWAIALAPLAGKTQVQLQDDAKAEIALQKQAAEAITREQSKYCRAQSTIMVGTVNCTAVGLVPAGQQTQVIALRRNHLAQIKWQITALGLVQSKAGHEPLQ
jgi:hypothetical protein